MSKGELHQLFQKYADKTCTPEEYAQFMAMVADQKTKAELDLLMDNEWQQNPSLPKLSNEKAEQLFDQVMASAEQRESRVKLLRSGLFKSWIPYAAASVLLSFFALFYFMHTAHNVKEIIALKKPENIKSAAVATTISMTTANEHRKIKLPDGSTVVLNNNSTIDFPRDFTGPLREVTLKGEGYFDIQHNPGKPFIVHAGKIKTTVLGTAFNINAYETGRNVVVTVTRGKVKVQNEGRTLGILVPNQQIVFNKIHLKSSLVPVVAKKSIEWQEKDLFFNEVTMEEAARELSQYFNVKISFANNDSKSCRFTATFLRGEGLEEILKVITSFNHADFKKEDGGIVISGEGCK